MTSTSELVVPLSALGAILAVGAIYGRVTAKLEEAHNRMDRMEKDQKQRESVVDQKLDSITEMLTDLRIAVGQMVATSNHPNKPKEA